MQSIEAAQGIALECAAAMVPKLLDFRPVFDVALPPEWVLIGRCRVGEGVEEGVGRSGGCFVLANAAVGVALVDLLPRRTRDAEAQFRRLLNAADFSVRCRGYLPVIHLEVGPDGLGALLPRIEEGFTYDSVLTIADRGRWVAILGEILAAGVTWEGLLSGPMPQRAADARMPLGRRWPGVVRGVLVGCGMLGLFGLGFAAALLLPPAPATRPPLATSGFGLIAEAAPAAMAPAPVQGAPAAMDPEMPETRTNGAALAASLGFGESAHGEQAEPVPASGETRIATLVAPARRAARIPLPIDRRCSEAVFRFQQGASLSSQDMAHVRQGCASWR